jgi:purine-binding chemotaxis protein CheW
MSETKTNTVFSTQVTNRFLSFSLGNEEYALSLLKIKEVVDIPEFAPIPFSPPHFLGIMNLRGQIISVIDLRRKFHMEPTPYSDQTAVIIIHVGSNFLGMLVDSVNRVLNLTDSDINPAPDFMESGRGAVVIGVARFDQKMILLLDVEKTLDVEDLTAIRNSGESNAA